MVIEDDETRDRQELVDAKALGEGGDNDDVGETG
jgi:hypothetical protein